VGGVVLNCNNICTHPVRQCLQKEPTCERWLQWLGLAWACEFQQHAYVASCHCAGPAMFEVDDG
jgi:hypothetical protein